MRATLLAVVLATGCAGVDPYLATGELLHTTGHEFVTVGTAMNAAYDAHTVDKTTYDRWAAFAKRFKPSYALAVQTWQFALVNKDAVAQGRVRDIIIALAADLSAFTPLVVDLIQEVKP